MTGLRIAVVWASMVLTPWCLILAAATSSGDLAQIGLALGAAGLLAAAYVDAHESHATPNQ